MHLMNKLKWNAPACRTAKQAGMTQMFMIKYDCCDLNKVSNPLRLDEVNT